MSDFLLELMVEEIPSKIQASVIQDFENVMIAELEKIRIVYNDVHSYISPRRIVFSARLNKNTEEFIEEKKGPQITAPPEIIHKFLKANNASKKDCTEKEINGKIFIFITVRHKPNNTHELLDKVIKNAVAKISWNKSMRWGSNQFYFTRPLRSVMAVFNNQLLDVKIDEICLQSCDYTLGHRFLAPQKISAYNIGDYLKKTRDSFVIVDQEERRKIILDGFKKCESEHGISVEINEELLEEVVGLVEYPVILLGKIPEKFMVLPTEAIVTPMQVHQRYFYTRVNRKLAPYFVFAANNITRDGGKTIIAGNERVLNARLSDAMFFFETDLQKPLGSRIHELSNIEYNSKLGTVLDRVKRIVLICNFICEDLQLSADIKTLLAKIAELSKCDLSTNMVREFTELQGIMGGYYAKIQGEKIEVCEAIQDQYCQADEITSNISALFALADKIETIASFFSIGKEPTGSKDPFALRRAAIGILKIIKKFDLNIELKIIFAKALECLPKTDYKRDTAEVIYAFIIDRLKIILKKLGIHEDVINRVATDKCNILTVYKKSEILNDFLRADSGEKFLLIYKRVNNIVGSNCETYVEKNLLRQDEEKNLLDQVEKLDLCITEIEKSGKNLIERFKHQLFACVEMESAVYGFFEAVLVNTDDVKIKQNRINLLTKLMYVFRRIL